MQNRLSFLSYILDWLEVAFERREVSSRTAAPKFDMVLGKLPLRSSPPMTLQHLIVHLLPIYTQANQLCRGG
jgi:hypothetical protein